MPKDIVSNNENRDAGHSSLLQNKKPAENVFFNGRNPVVQKLETLFQANNVLSLKDFEPLTKQKGLPPRYTTQNPVGNTDFLILGTALWSWESSKPLVIGYLCSGLYKRLLYNQASSVELVGDNYDRQKMLHLGHSFPKNVKIIPTLFSNSQKKKVKSIKGWPKVVASCLLLGENNAHPYKLFAFSEVPIPEDPQYSECTAVKIEHTHSGVFSSDEKKLRANLFSLLALNNSKAQKQYLSCNLIELQNALSEMVKISDAEIESLIFNRAERLKRYFLINYPKMPQPQKEFYQNRIQSKAENLIGKVIRQRDIIQNDFLKSLEVIEMIGQGRPHYIQDEWMILNYSDSKDTPENFSTLSIDRLITIALAKTKNAKDLQRLKEITQHFHTRILNTESTIQEKSAALKNFEVSAQWEEVYKLEQDPLFELIKKAKELNDLQEFISFKRHNLLGHEIKDDLYSAQVEKSLKGFLEWKKMEWMLENHASKTLDLPDSKMALRFEVLAENPVLLRKHKDQLLKEELIEFLESDEDEFIRILFEPTDCLVIQHNKKIMLNILDENPSLKERIYPLHSFRNIQEDFLRMQQSSPDAFKMFLESSELDEQSRATIKNILESDRSHENELELQAKKREVQAKVEKEYLFKFMELYPDKVSKLLKSDTLDPQDRVRMKTILKDPTTRKERELAEKIYKSCDIETAINLYKEPGTNGFTKLILFLLHYKNNKLRFLAVQDWRNWLKATSPKNVYEKFMRLKKGLYRKQDIAESLLMSYVLQDNEMQILFDTKYEEYKETLGDQKVRMRC